jgi:hypothetical protein
MSQAQDGSFLALSGTACHTARTSAAQMLPAVVTTQWAAPEPPVVAAIRVKTPIGAAVPPAPIAVSCEILSAYSAVKRRVISSANPGRSWEISIENGMKSFGLKMVILG